MFSQDDFEAYYRTCGLLMECARKAQLLADTANRDTEVPQGVVETQAHAFLQHRLAGICMECLEKSHSLAMSNQEGLEKSHSLAADSSKDDDCSIEWTLSSS